MQKIVPFLWFDGRVEEGIDFYVSVFRDAKRGNITRQGGQAFWGSMTLAGRDFHVLNGGPMYKITPSISFFVECADVAEADVVWEKLSEGGEVKMEYGPYPWAEKFGWIQDKFGVSWQVMVAHGERGPQRIVPSLMYLGAVNGKAEEAMGFYTSLFAESTILSAVRYGNEAGAAAGTLMIGRFLLHGEEFKAMDSGAPHKFTFTPGVSLFVNCGTQAEVDDLWARLTADGKEIKCGWLVDKFGVSWQIIPTALGQLMSDPNPKKAQAVMQAMLGMVKIDVAGLRAAHDAAG